MPTALIKGFHPNWVNYKDTVCKVEMKVGIKSSPN